MALLLLIRLKYCGILCLIITLAWGYIKLMQFSRCMYFSLVCQQDIRNNILDNRMYTYWYLRFYLCPQKGHPKLSLIISKKKTYVSVY